MKLTRGERFCEARKALPEGKNTIAEVSKQTGVTGSLIQALEDDDNTRDVGYSKVAALARYYGVSTDYLLCLSNVQTFDTDVRAVCESTGLSETTIIRLSQIKNSTDTTRSSYFLVDLIDELVGAGKCIEIINDNIYWATLATAIKSKIKSPVAKGLMEAEMIQDLINTANKPTQGTISVPAEDAAFWYLDRATGQIAFLVQQSLTKTINTMLKEMESGTNEALNNTGDGDSNA